MLMGVTNKWHFSYTRLLTLCTHVSIHSDSTKKCQCRYTINIWMYQIKSSRHRPIRCQVFVYMNICHVILTYVVRYIGTCYILWFLQINSSAHYFVILNYHTSPVPKNLQDLYFGNFIIAPYFKMTFLINREMIITPGHHYYQYGRSSITIGYLLKYLD